MRPGRGARFIPASLVSIHAPRAGCDFNIRYNASNNWVSIHAPRAGCDDSAFGYVPRYDVSIHAPRAGCDTVIVLLPSISSCFNSRTPCGVRLGSVSVLGVVYSVSIHAPRAGCDSTSSSTSLYLLGFQFTHPVRGATNVKNQVLYASGTFQFTHPVRGATWASPFVRTSSCPHVSIHAPRAGCDFYRCDYRGHDEAFQFTHPVRGATW